MVVTLYRLSLCRIVKPQNILAPLNGTPHAVDQGCAKSGCVHPDSVERARLKELFQQDLDDTIVEMLASGSENTDPQTILKELTFHGK